MFALLPRSPLFAGRLRRFVGLLVVGLLAALAQPGQAATPPDSTRLHARPALPDTARLRLLNSLSRAYGPTDPTRCIRFALRGLPLARALHQGETELGLLDNIAISYARSGNLPLALRYCLEELRRARQLGNRRFEIDALMAVGNVQSNENNQQEAEASLREALALAKQYGQPLQLARVQAQLGNYYLAVGRYAECEQIISEALPVFRRQGRFYEQGDCLSSLAEAACAQTQYTAALVYGREAAALMRRKGDLYGQAWVGGVLCRAALRSGKPVLARQYGQDAVRLAKQAAIPGAEAEVIGELISTYAQQGAYADAFKLQQRLTFLNDSIFNLNRASEMARMQTQYETETKRQQIRTLTHRNRIQALERERDRTRLQWLTVGALALLAALLLFALLYRRLQHSRASLGRSNRTKDQLLSILGHDLRGPVAAFQQVAPILRHYAKEPNPTELTELADEIGHGATQLAGLLDNMLHWARAQMGEVVNRPTALEPAVAVQKVIKLYRTSAALKAVNLQGVAPALDESPAVWADDALLDTVLRNLVSNAIKFTPTQGTVELAAVATPQGIEFSVRDTGVGMTPEALVALQEPVVRPTRGTAGEVGTGLGLTVCRQFVSLLGGDLQVSSEAGQGTRFWFTLPVAKNAEPAAHTPTPTAAPGV